MLRFNQATILGTAIKIVSSHHGFGWDFWSAVCMNYNIVALFLVDFVLNTDRETIYFLLYTQPTKELGKSFAKRRISL